MALYLKYLPHREIIVFSWQKLDKIAKMWFIPTMKLFANISYLKVSNS